MDSGNAQAICAVLPAGNANDHSRTLQEKPLSTQIINGRVTKIDLIEVAITSAKGKKVTEYAHSYVGLGLTPVVAAELNKKSLNALKELHIVVTTFFKYRPFKISHDGKTLRLDSQLFANINKMAKVLTLAPDNKPDDGKFEVIQFPAGRKLRLLKHLTQAAVTNLDKPNRTNKYEFTTLKRMPVQLDGEVTILQPQVKVVVKAAVKKLKTII
jgi:diacylglycerol kinase family enzyme